MSFKSIITGTGGNSLLTKRLLYITFRCIRETSVIEGMLMSKIFLPVKIREVECFNNNY